MGATCQKILGALVLNFSKELENRHMGYLIETFKTRFIVSTREKVRIY